MSRRSAATRERLLDAAYRCVARHGIAKTSLEDVAREANVSRPTLYRYFPGGKDALMREVVAWEATRFLGEITGAVAGVGDLPRLLEELVVVAGRRIAEHAVLQKVLETEPERLLPLLVTGSDRLIALLKPLILLAMQRGPEPAAAIPGDLDEVADYLARMTLSIVGSPGGRNLADRREVRELVRVELLGFL